jgi:glycopeptide antibiotics resistance protein
MKCTNLNPLASFTNPYYFYPIKALIIHLLLFIPVGIIFSEYKHSFLYFIIICIVLECMQLVLKTGVFDINTLILYSIGYFIGSLFSKKIYNP